MSIQLKSIQLKNSYINLLKYSYINLLKCSYINLLKCSHVVVFLCSYVVMFLYGYVVFNSIQSSSWLIQLSLCIIYMVNKTNIQFNYIILNCNKPIERIES